jgi:VanZ family protein
VTPLSGDRARAASAVSLAAWCVATFVLSSQSDPEDFVGVHVALNDKVVHGIEYATGGFLAAGAFGFLRGRRRLTAAALFCGLWGASDEWHQSFVPGRDSSIVDVAADVAGATIGVLAFSWTAGRGRSPRESVCESDKSKD